MHISEVALPRLTILIEMNNSTVKCKYIWLLRLCQWAYAASQTTMLHMKRLNQTESPVFMSLCVLCFFVSKSNPFLLLSEKESTI